MFVNGGNDSLECELVNACSFISRFNVQWALNIRPEYQVYFLYLQKDFPSVLISFEYTFNIPPLQQHQIWRKNIDSYSKRMTLSSEKVSILLFFFRIFHSFSLTTLLHWRLTQFSCTHFPYPTSLPFNLDLSTQFFISFTIQPPRCSSCSTPICFFEEKKIIQSNGEDKNPRHYITQYTVCVHLCIE